MPVFNIAAEQRMSRLSYHQGRALQAGYQHRELTNEALQRKIDLAPEIEAYERRKRGEEDAAQRQAVLDKLRGYEEIIQSIDSPEEWERSREAASSLRRIHPMLSEQALKDFYLTATEEEIKALERIEAKHK